MKGRNTILSFISSVSKFRVLEITQCVTVGLCCLIWAAVLNVTSVFFCVIIGMLQVEMEDFDANIEEQKDEKKDAEEEESELVGDRTTTLNKVSLY